MIPGARDSRFMLAAAILAAGRAIRMGSQKLLLPWGKTSILGHLVAEWRALGAAQIGVVRAADDDLIAAELERPGVPAADPVINPAPDRGMFSSIQCAPAWKGWKSGLTHWAIVLGDQPHLQRQTLHALLEFSAANEDRICMLTQGGHRRHPVLLPRNKFHQLSETTVPNMKSFLDANAECLSLCPVDDPALALDIDLPEDYRVALEKYGSK